ncbi:MAG TPA: SH3 domain-containing protein [Thermomicrobiales bacterium]
MAARLANSRNRRSSISFPVAILAILVALCTALPAADWRSAAAMQSDSATPVPSPEAETPVDLPALTLVPADIQEDGYRLVDGQMATFDPSSATLAEDAAAIADLRGTDEEIDELIPFLETIGWRRHYQALLAQPRSEGSDRFRRSITSFITEYADSDGAAIDFILLQNASVEAGHTDVPGTRTFADISRISRVSDSDPDTGEEYAALDLVFRHGRLIAGVSIVDFNGEEPTIAEIEALAEILLERIEAGSQDAEPGLSDAVLRPAPASGSAFGYTAEYYERVHGEAVPLFSESEEEAEERDERHAAAGITDIYRLEAESDDGSYAYSATLARFADAESAGAWLQETPDRLAADPGPLAAITAMSGTTIGDESLTFSYEYPLDGVAARGYLIVARVDAQVATIRLDALPEAPLSAVEELAAVQVDCLAAGSCPESREIPLDASQLEPAPVPAATAEQSDSGATYVTDPEFAVDLREEPSATAAIVASLPPGTPVVILGEATDEAGEIWFQVEAETGEVGWLREIDVLEI